MMDKELLDYVKEKTEELRTAPSCCRELRTAAEAWLAALGTEKEKDALAAYIAELEADIMPVDGLIAFAESETGQAVFGKETAAVIAAHGYELKAKGVPWPARRRKRSLTEKTNCWEKRDPTRTGKNGDLRRRPFFSVSGIKKKGEYHEDHSSAVPGSRERETARLSERIPSERIP